MFQFAFVAALFKLSARTPSIRSLFALPNRMATATDTDSSPCFIFLLYWPLKVSLGEDPQTPYAASSGDAPAGGNRRTDAPMYQYAFVAAASKRSARTPSSRS